MIPFYMLILVIFNLVLVDGYGQLAQCAVLHTAVDEKAFVH